MQVFAPLFGNLPQTMALDEIESTCVHAFNDSISRPLIWSGFLNCYDRVRQDRFIGFLWLSGEFATSCSEPRCAMLLVRVPSSFSINPAQQTTIDWLRGDENADSMCDTYFLHEVEPSDPAYDLYCEIEEAIREEFTAQPDGTRKGYAVLRIEHAQS